MKGEFKLKLGDRLVSAPAQSVMFVPRGTAHTFQNVGIEPGVILVGVTPGGFEKSFEERQGADAETLRALAKKYNMNLTLAQTCNVIFCKFVVFATFSRSGAGRCADEKSRREHW